MRFIDSFEKNSDSAFYDYVKDKYSLSFYSIIKSDKRFEWIDDEYARFISEKSCLLYDTKFERNGYVGFAIAGYGDNEIFPQLTHVHVQGYINGKLKYHIVENVSISDNTIASIVPLAQTDVMQTFLFGINDSFLNELSNTIPNELLNTIGDKTGIICADRTDDFNVLVLKSRDSIVSKMANKAKAEYMKPIIISVSTLPIEEMALLAESMINITSLRRKVALDNNIGTVGGPIDVSIISKGDGFIWLKRKHYFDRKLNPQYFYSHFESNKEVNEE